MTDRKVLRHSLEVRLVHWLMAGSGLLLCFSGIGFMPLYGRFYLNALPGLAWVSDFDLQLSLHYLSAALFGAAGCYHLLIHLRRGEFAALPRRGDLGESWALLRALLRGAPEPPHGKFLAEQRLAYLAIALTSLVLLVTGLLLTWKNLTSRILDPGLLQLTILLHLAASLLFIALVGLHLAAFALRANRPLLASMLTGRVSATYARGRHPRWAVPPSPAAPARPDKRES